MKKTKIEQRIENAFNAFFDDENSIENNFLIYSENANLRQKDSSQSSVEKAGIFVKILKQIFLFLPGTAILSCNVFLLTVLNLHSHLDFGFVDFYRFFFGSTIIAAVMTILGIGSIRKAKDLVIPGSIFLVSLLAGIIVCLSGIGSLNFINGVSVYLLPLALVVPFLAKGLVANMERTQI